MIATICKSCNTIDRGIVSRCKYCGSRMVEVKVINPKCLRPRAKGRDILTEFEKGDAKGMLS